MTAKRLLRAGGGTTAERKRRRQQLGPLRSRQVRPGTLVRYERATVELFWWMRACQIAVPATTVEFDTILCEYAEELWQVTELAIRGVLQTY